MTGQLLGAYLTGGAVGLLVGGVAAVFLLQYVVERVDRATTLPPVAEPPTVRLAAVADINIDMRRHRRTWTA